MKPAHILCASLLAAAACAPTTAGTLPEPASGAELGCSGFADALRACAPMSCGQPHVFVPSFTIEHQISGIDAGACAYTQSMPGDMTMACRLSETGRNELAADMEAFQRTGEMSFSFSTSDPTPDTAMTRECEIRDRDGELIPWGVSQR